jgi:hypothetical protein
MCVSPISIYNREQDRTIPVPCNRCPSCTKLKINSWIFRLKQEQKISTSTSFITLTYEDKHLRYSENGQPTLRKIDVQNFMKALRKEQLLHTTQTLKYYAVGEYGSKYGRPHYHIIMFNLHPKTNLSNAWKYGFIDVSQAREASINYTLKYISKPKTKPKNGEQLREFSLMSKGLGSNYLTNSIKKYHSQLDNCYLTTENGYKMPLPKYYKEKLYNDTQRPLVTEIIKKRAENQREKTLKYLLKKSQNPELLLEIRQMYSKFDKRIQETF